MPFNTDIRQDYLLVRHEGKITPAEAEMARDEVLLLARRNKLSKVIIDFRGVTGDADPNDLRLFMEDNSKVTPPRPHAAIIVREDQHSQFRFIEDFAVSRGMPIRVFVDEDAALSWLVA